MKVRISLWFCFIICLSAPALMGADPEGTGLHESDIAMLRNKQSDEQNHIHHHDIKFMRTRSSNLLVRYNPVSLLFGSLMYAYQGYVSPQLPSECLFVESCSHFSKNLIAEYGLFKGVFTTSDRLMRCNRVSALDVHPMMIDENSGKVIESVDIYKFRP